MRQSVELPPGGTPCFCWHVTNHTILFLNRTADGGGLEEKHYLFLKRLCQVLCALGNLLCALLVSKCAPESMGLLGNHLLRNQKHFVTSLMLLMSHCSTSFFTILYSKSSSIKSGRGRIGWCCWVLWYCLLWVAVCMFVDIESHCVALAGLRLTDPPASAFQSWD